MTEPSAQRTLVKSPPELWAEISDQDALARHLGEFGAIRITRSDPETTVAWEGDRMRGTVELEASGWGTKVTLTAEATSSKPSDPVVEEVTAPVAASARGAVPLTAAPAPAPRPAASRRPGLLARFRRRPRAVAPPRVESFSHAQRSDVTPRRDPGTPAAVARASTPRDPLPPAATASRQDSQAVETVLVGVLDELGSAQKRPFGR